MTVCKLFKMLMNLTERCELESHHQCGSATRTTNSKQQINTMSSSSFRHRIDFNRKSEFLLSSLLFIIFLNYIPRKSLMSNVEEQVSKYSELNKQIVQEKLPTLIFLNNQSSGKSTTAPTLVAVKSVISSYSNNAESTKDNLESNLMKMMLNKENYKSTTALPLINLVVENEKSHLIDNSTSLSTKTTEISVDSSITNSHSEHELKNRIGMLASSSSVRSNTNLTKNHQQQQHSNHIISQKLETTELPSSSSYASLDDSNDEDDWRNNYLFNSLYPNNQLDESKSTTPGPNSAANNELPVAETIETTTVAQQMEQAHNNNETNQDLQALETQPVKSLATLLPMNTNMSLSDKSDNFSEKFETSNEDNVRKSTLSNGHSNYNQPNSMKVINSNSSFGEELNQDTLIPKAGLADLLQIIRHLNLVRGSGSQPLAGSYATNMVESPPSSPQMQNHSNANNLPSPSVQAQLEKISSPSIPNRVLAQTTSLAPPPKSPLLFPYTPLKFLLDNRNLMLKYLVQQQAEQSAQKALLNNQIDFMSTQESSPMRSSNMLSASNVNQTTNLNSNNGEQQHQQRNLNFLENTNGNNQYKSIKLKKLDKHTLVSPYSANFDIGSQLLRAQNIGATKISSDNNNNNTADRVGVKNFSTSTDSTSNQLAINQRVAAAAGSRQQQQQINLRKNNYENGNGDGKSPQSRGNSIIYYTTDATTPNADDSMNNAIFKTLKPLSSGNNDNKLIIKQIDNNNNNNNVNYLKKIKSGPQSASKFKIIKIHGQQEAIRDNFNNESSSSSNQIIAETTSDNNNSTKRGEREASRQRKNGQYEYNQHKQLDVQKQQQNDYNEQVKVVVVNKNSEPVKKQVVPSSNTLASILTSKQTAQTASGVDEEQQQPLRQPQQNVVPLLKSNNFNRYESTTDSQSSLASYLDDPHKKSLYYTSEQAFLDEPMTVNNNHHHQRPLTIGELARHHGVPFRLKSPLNDDGESFTNGIDLNSLSNNQTNLNNIEENFGLTSESGQYEDYATYLQNPLTNQTKLNNNNNDNNLFPFLSAHPPLGDTRLENDLKQQLGLKILEMAARNPTPISSVILNSLPNQHQVNGYQQATLNPSAQLSNIDFNTLNYIYRNNNFKANVGDQIPSPSLNFQQNLAPIKTMLMPPPLMLDANIQPEQSNQIVQQQQQQLVSNKSNGVNLVVTDLANKWALSRMPDLVPIPLAATVPGYLIRLPNGKILAAALTNMFSIQGIQKGPLTLNYKRLLNQRFKSLTKQNNPNQLSAGSIPNQQKLFHYANLASDTGLQPQIVIPAPIQINSAQLLSELAQNHQKSSISSTTNSNSNNNKDKDSKSNTTGGGGGGGLFSRGVFGQLGFGRQQATNQRNNQTNITTRDTFSNKLTNSKKQSNNSRQKIIKLTNSPYPIPNLSDQELANLPIADLNEPVFSFADESQLLDAGPEYNVPVPMPMPVAESINQNLLVSNSADPLRAHTANLNYGQSLGSTNDLTQSGATTRLRLQQLFSINSDTMAEELFKLNTRKRKSSSSIRATILSKLESFLNWLLAKQTRLLRKRDSTNRICHDKTIMTNHH